MNHARAILWARVSDPRRKIKETDEQHKQRVQQDLNNQLIPLENAALKHGWEVVHTAKVEHTAWDKEPPEKEEVERMLKQYNIDVLAVWSIDRWSRGEGGDAVKALNDIVHLEQQYKVSFFSIQEEFLSTATLDPGIRKILIHIFAWIAETESKRRSARVKAAVDLKRIRAGNIGQNPRWGGGKIPSPNEEAAIKADYTGEDKTLHSLRSLARKYGYSASTIHRIVSQTDGD